MEIEDLVVEPPSHGCEKYIATVAAYHHAFKSLPEEEQEKIGREFLESVMKDMTEEELGELLELAYYADLAIQEDEKYKSSERFQEKINEEIAYMESMSTDYE